jgi:hypothetical protein
MVAPQNDTAPSSVGQEIGHIFVCAHGMVCMPDVLSFVTNICMEYVQYVDTMTVVYKCKGLGRSQGHPVLVEVKVNL